jgi:hypothetical protein
MPTSRRLALTSSSVFASLRRFRRPSGPRRDFRKTNEFAAQARTAVQWSGEFLPKPATAVYGFEDPRHSGAGYIGSHTCKALAAVGYGPIVLGNLSTGHRDRWNLVKEFGVGGCNSISLPTLISSATSEIFR